jgi:hypothetical protein
MKKITYLFFLFVTTISLSQIGIGTTSPDASSALDLSSINSGLLIPRMIESERVGITNPATGLMVYQTDATSGFYYYDGATWAGLGDTTADAITLDNYKDYTDAVKVTNTATGNVNTGVLTFNYFTTTNELGTNRGQFTLDTDGIIPNFTGTVDIIFNIELDMANADNTQRSSVGFRWYHNSAYGPWVRHAYIRRAGNHLKSSINFSTTIDVVANQKIFIQSDDFAGGGTVTSPAGGVEFIVIRRK